MEIYQLYLNLLHNPFTMKHLKDLEQYYLHNGMTKEADAFGQLIALRLQNDNNTHTHPKQPESN
jgi:hypothetical protein